MIKFNKKQVLKSVKTTTKTFLYKLKPEVKKITFNNSLNLPIINLSVKIIKSIGFINAYISRKKDK
ncbi:hypothetical protein VY86_00265 [Photorhabdus thracensis]|uniref:Uncharacterized protein n=1 Tax=Photorhabdus thracensis TaxID=230089 RepID=A0A0F7LH97_9GAMM|nr:hypothetical protein VY86_00265 [Photorhabdus thracensis]